MQYSVKEDSKENFFLFLRNNKIIRTIYYYFDGFKTVSFEYHYDKTSHVKNLDYTGLYLFRITSRFTNINIFYSIIRLISSFKFTFLDNFRLKNVDVIVLSIFFIIVL